MAVKLRYYRRATLSTGTIRCDASCAVKTAPWHVHTYFRSHNPGPTYLNTALVHNTGYVPRSRSGARSAEVLLQYKRLDASMRRNIRRPHTPAHIDRGNAGQYRLAWMLLSVAGD